MGISVSDVRKAICAFLEFRVEERIESQCGKLLPQFNTSNPFSQSGIYESFDSSLVIDSLLWSESTAEQAENESRLRFETKLAQIEEKIESPKDVLLIPQSFGNLMEGNQITVLQFFD